MRGKRYLLGQRGGIVDNVYPYLPGGVFFIEHEEYVPLGFLVILLFRQPPFHRYIDAAFARGHGTHFMAYSAARFAQQHQH